MEPAVKYDRETIMAAMEENQKNVRNMVLDGYQEMLEGKGRSHKEFFEELEGKYKNAKV